MNEPVCVIIKDYLKKQKQKQAAGQIWPADHGMRILLKKIFYNT